MEILGIKWIEKSGSPDKPRYLITGTIIGGIAGLSLVFFGADLFSPSGGFELLIIGPLVGFVVTECKMRSHLLQRKNN